MIKKIRRFVWNLAVTRRLWLQSPVVWRNVRALWIQSDTDWMSKLEPLEVSDEEFEAMREAWS
jgi:hypothetical protein